ncbi:uncharacterized protein F5891DRAFT_1042291 [Suillus fuscotomentosus]|uniref:Uncharacterized protein n=1 Tax=Suillus fuscotomentosus TaxID=1912939 RepID=A0AAD4E2Y7_9AGAM|nr:uncharacterized protein F5891DRAFT_1042291 [Suillus fuscotomentosus]KAG1898764.1 hypothetical protein F5891DRAFT_1042291 [Suillus fuscotomentosus]
MIVFYKRYHNSVNNAEACLSFVGVCIASYLDNFTSQQSEVPTLMTGRFTCAILQSISAIAFRIIIMAAS